MHSWADARSHPFDAKVFAPRRARNPEIALGVNQITRRSKRQVIVCRGSTRLSPRLRQDIMDYDQATELEKLGGKVIELSGQDWSRVGKSSEAT